MTEVLFIGGTLDHQTRYLRHPCGKYKVKNHWWESGELYKLYSICGLVFYFHTGMSLVSALECLTHQYMGGGPSQFRASYLCLGGSLNGAWIAIKDIKTKKEFETNGETYLCHDIGVDGEALWVYFYAEISSIDALRYLYEDYKE